jgi:hypothetical protein
VFGRQDTLGKLRPTELTLLGFLNPIVDLGSSVHRQHYGLIRHIVNVTGSGCDLRVIMKMGDHLGFLLF